jgi:hypothetical protein
MTSNLLAANGELDLENAFPPARRSSSCPLAHVVAT